MPEKHKHFHVFTVRDGDLEEKLNSLYQDGFSVVQVIPLHREEHEVTGEKCPYTGYDEYKVHQIVKIVCIQVPQLDLSAINRPSTSK